MHPSVENKFLAEFVASVDQEGAIPDSIVESFQSVDQEYKAFQKILAGSPRIRIYGLSTLPGHRDGDKFPEHYSDSYQEGLIYNHALDSATFFPEELGRFITLSKLYSISAGGSLISPDLFQIIMNIYKYGNIKYEIPRNSSYSSGDVIPASHWARSIIEAAPNYKLKPGEGMALINGAFVHVGTAVWSLGKVEKLLSMILVTSKYFFRFTNVDDSFFEYEFDAERYVTSNAIHFISEFSEPPNQDQQQSPVSIRATPQILDGFISSLIDLRKELNFHLSKPSGNPQIRKGSSGDRHITPSGSFIAPTLSLTQGKLIDSLLMIAAYIVRRTEYFLSGNIDGICRDGQTDDNPLGFIQWPKLLAAMLEDLRTRFSRRVFGSLPITSYGVEDFSSNGLSTTEYIDEITDIVIDMIIIEYAIIQSATTGTKICLDRSLDCINNEVKTYSTELIFTNL